MVPCRDLREEEGTSHLHRLAAITENQPLTRLYEAEDASVVVVALFVIEVFFDHTNSATAT